MAEEIFVVGFQLVDAVGVTGVVAVVGALVVDAFSPYVYVAAEL